MSARTSLTHPLEVQFIPSDWLETPGRLGITFAPGKQAPSWFGEPWQRNLDLDLQRLVEVYHTDCLVSLLEEQEYSDLKIPDLRKKAAALGMRVLHLPIPDGSTPPDAVEFQAVIQEAIALLHADKTVVVHCRGGLGRAGTITAAILVGLGRSPEVAIQQVRETRPGAIENQQQEQFLLGLVPYTI